MAAEKAKSGYRYKAKSGGADILCDFNCTVSVHKTSGKTNARSASGSKIKSKVEGR